MPDIIPMDQILHVAGPEARRIHRYLTDVATRNPRARTLVDDYERELRTRWEFEIAARQRTAEDMAAAVEYQEWAAKEQE